MLPRCPEQTSVCKWLKAVGKTDVWSANHLYLPITLRQTAWLTGSGRCDQHLITIQAARTTLPVSVLSSFDVLQFQRMKFETSANEAMEPPIFCTSFMVLQCLPYISKSFKMPMKKRHVQSRRSIQWRVVCHWVNLPRRKWPPCGHWTAWQHFFSAQNAWFFHAFSGWTLTSRRAPHLMNFPVTTFHSCTVPSWDKARHVWS